MSPPRPLLWVSLGFLSGIGLAGNVFLPVSVWLFIAVIALLLGILWYFIARTNNLDLLARDVTSVTVFLFVFFLGAARYQAAVPVLDASDLAWFNDREYDTLITGWVTAPPDRRDNYSSLRVRATGIDTGDGDDLEVDGLLLARVDPNEEYEYGNIVRLRGRLKTPAEDEDFSYRDYLARQSVYSTMSSAEATIIPGRDGNLFESSLYALKEYAFQTTYTLFPDPEASLLAGILLGLDNGLPDDLHQDFMDTGTSHILAISGFNITIIAALFLSIFGRAFGSRRGAVFAGFGTLFFILLVAADAAVVRAAVMGVVALFARHFGRRQDGLVTLFGISALMSLYNPYYLQDVGFQLCFAASLGLILYGEPLLGFAARLLSKFKLQAGTVEKVSQPISDFILLTLAAQITTLPIMSFHFNRLSLVSFIANPFILPAQPAVMILGGLADSLGMIFLPLGQLAALLAWPFVAYTTRMVELFAGLPGATVSVDFPFWGVIAWYAALLGPTLGREPLKEFFHTLKTRIPTIPIWAVLTALTLLVVIIWRAVFSIPDGKLHITFLNTGTSDAILIQTPSGDNILVNGGESLSQLSSQIGQRLPLFNRTLNWLIVASTQENQVAALPRLMERYPPGRALWAGNVEASHPARALNAWLISHQVRVTRAEKDQTLDLGDGATLTVVAVDARGAILLVEYGSLRVLLPVGMSFDSRNELAADDSLPALTGLLLADSGLAQLNSAGWIDFLDPQLVILSISADNFSGLPDQETLDSLGERTLLRTDINGWIELSSDGHSIWVDVEFPSPAIPLTLTPADDGLSAPIEDPYLTDVPYPTDDLAPSEEPVPTEDLSPADEPFPTESPSVSP